MGIKEITRLIWHVQLTSHNGGDFFNEVFDEHPNLLCLTSFMMDKVEEKIAENLEVQKKARDSGDIYEFSTTNPNMSQRMNEVTDWTAKDMLVAMYLNTTEVASTLDHGSRIAPAVFFQPHFLNLTPSLAHCVGNELQLSSAEADVINASPLFRGFKYVKTFAPMRRPTTSYAACIRFSSGTFRARMLSLNQQIAEEGAQVHSIRMVNYPFTYAVTRSFMADPDDRLNRDSMIVRFEDGKLNPRATFTALAAFLDLPYTESMTYCSFKGERDPEVLKGNTRGFDSSIVYRTYEEYAGDAERCYLEYCLRDAYKFYGYDFHYYDGKPVTEEDARRLIENFTTFEKYYDIVWSESNKMVADMELTDVQKKVHELSTSDKVRDGWLQNYRENQLSACRILSKDIKFVNKNRKPMRMIPLLKLDPALLETELYH